MVAHHITTGREGGGRQNKGEMSVSTLLQALLKSAKSTTGFLLSERCLFFALFTATTKGLKIQKGPIKTHCSIKVCLKNTRPIFNFIPVNC